MVETRKQAIIHYDESLTDEQKDSLARFELDIRMHARGGTFRWRAVATKPSGDVIIELCEDAGNPPFPMGRCAVQASDLPAFTPAMLQDRLQSTAVPEGSTPR